MSNARSFGPMVILGDAVVGETLIGRPNSIKDADGIDYSTATFQWLRDGEPILGASGQFYQVSSADLGSRLSVEYSYTDFGGTRETVLSDPRPAVTNPGTPPDGGSTPPPGDDDGGGTDPDNPNNSLPAGPMMILGDAEVGETLIARPNGISDADGINYSSATFQWLRDGEPISGATGQSYEVTNADRGSQISVEWSYRDNGGTRETVVSEPEPPVPGGTPTPPSDGGDDTPAPPSDGGGDTPAPGPLPGEFDNAVPIGLLYILGFPVEGSELLVRTDAVFDRDGFDPSVASFQWMRDGAPILGATGKTYTVSSDDRGAQISVKMSYVDGAGKLETIESAQEPAVPFPAGEEPDAPVGGDAPSPGAPADGTLLGTPEADTLVAQAGLQMIDGLADDDTVELPGNQRDYTLTLTPEGTTITDRSEGGLGTIELDNIESLDFGTDLPVFGDEMDLEAFTGHVGLDAATLEALITMYIAYYNRAPDAIGLGFWGTAYANGMSMEEIAAEFATQPETMAFYADKVSNISFTSAVYENVLGRSADSDGLRYWADELDVGNMTRSDAILRILEGVEAGSDDAAYLETKTDIGALFAVQFGMSNVDDANAVMQEYDGSAASVESAVDTAEALFTAASGADGGDFLMPLVGVLDDPLLF
mgnify:FL=1